MSEEAGQTTTTAGETTEGKINIAEEMDAHEAMQKIRGDIAQTEPLIGPQEPISVLEQEFKGHEERLAQLEITKKHYSFIRRMRRDGDCFYRGYLCGLLEFCADKTNIDAASKLLAHFKEYLDILSIFHEKFLIEDFHALLQEQMEWAIASNPSSADIAERVSEPTIAMTVITMARLMCGGDMRSKPDQYEWIAPPGTTLDQFIASEVSPTYSWIASLPAKTFVVNNSDHRLQLKRLSCLFFTHPLTLFSYPYLLLSSFHFLPYPNRWSLWAQKPITFRLQLLQKHSASASLSSTSTRAGPAS